MFSLITPGMIARSSAALGGDPGLDDEAGEKDADGEAKGSLQCEDRQKQ